MLKQQEIDKIEIEITELNSKSVEINRTIKQRDNDLFTINNEYE